MLSIVETVDEFCGHKSSATCLVFNDEFVFSGGLDNRILAFSLENFKFRNLIRNKFVEEEEYSGQYNIYVEMMGALLKRTKKKSKNDGVKIQKEKNKEKNKEINQEKKEESDFLKNPPPKQEILPKVPANQAPKEAKPFKSEELPEKEQIEPEEKEEEMQDENKVPQQKIIRKEKQMKK